MDERERLAKATEELEALNNPPLADYFPTISMTQFKSCPFCGDELNFIEVDGQPPVAMHPHGNHCLLSDEIIYLTEEYLSLWNQRVKP